LRNRAAGGRLAEPGLPWVHLRSVQEFHCVPCRGLGSRAVSIGYKTSVHCHGKQSIDTAAGDYGSVWLAFPAKARRHRSGAFMRSQVRLKSSVGPLHSKSSMEVNTGTSTRSVARVRNNTASSHAAKRDSAKARALRTIGSAAFFLPRIFLGALLRANSYAPQLRSFCFPGSFPNRHDSSQRRTSATFSLGSSEQSGQLPQRAIRSMQSQLLVAQVAQLRD
jgi:hypothetical protein